MKQINDYATHNVATLEHLLEHGDAYKLIQILEGILNDATIPFDVAFCRLIIMLSYTQLHVAFATECIAFFAYFLVGSCFPFVRPHIKFIYEDPSYSGYGLLRYLVETYFPNLNDNRCIKFKYSGTKATHVILSVVEQHITPSIASMICDFVQYPNYEFVHFMNNFLWHFPLELRSHWWRCISNITGFLYALSDTSEPTDRHLLSRLLLNRSVINVCTDRLTVEAHSMALMKLKTGADICRYIGQSRAESIQCYDTNPRLFIDLVESAVSNLRQVLRDAVVNHSLSVFFNGNKEEDVLPNYNMWSKHNQTIWNCIENAKRKAYKKRLSNVQYIFENIIVVYFDGNDLEFVRIMLVQFVNFLKYPIECEGRDEVIAWFQKYSWSHDFFEAARAMEDWFVYPPDTHAHRHAPPPSKKRRMN